MKTAALNIEVVYALPDRQDRVVLQLAEGATAMDAVEASGLLRRYPDIDPGGGNKLGVFAHIVKPETVLRDGDRVEIYRPLIADPKQGRQRRVSAKRAQNGGRGGWRGG